jgi:general stress protein YciG
VRGPFLWYTWTMNQLCKHCDQPRKPRHDRPGKFFTLCVDHYAEYQRQKNKESYKRNAEKRRGKRKEIYWSDPEKAREIANKSGAKPEIRERKRKYMELYLRPWRAYVKLTCERCGFKAEDSCQMDVHHKDGDKQNNDPSNLVSLCPPCHRITHKQNL